MRPSVSSRKTLRPSTQTRIASASVCRCVLTIVVFIVFVLQVIGILVDQSLNLPHGFRVKTSVRGQSHRLQPKLAFAIRRGDMYVRRLTPFI